MGRYFPLPRKNVKNIPKKEGMKADEATEKRNKGKRNENEKKWPDGVE